MFDVFDLPFVQRGLWAVLLLAVPGGLLGTWIVLRSMAFYAHATGTAAFPGLSTGSIRVRNSTRLGGGQAYALYNLCCDCWYRSPCRPPWPSRSSSAPRRARERCCCSAAPVDGRPGPRSRQR